MLRDPAFISGRRARFLGVLPNSKSDKLKHDITAGLPKRPVTHGLGVELTEGKVTAALKSTMHKKQRQWNQLNAQWNPSSSGLTTTRRCSGSLTG